MNNSPTLYMTEVKTLSYKIFGGDDKSHLRNIVVDTIVDRDKAIELARQLFNSGGYPLVRVQSSDKLFKQDFGQSEE